MLVYCIQAFTHTSVRRASEAAAALEASERLGRALLAVVEVRPAVRRLAVNALNLVTTAGTRDVRCERPLANAPVLHRTESPLAVALHIIVAPVRLARHLAEIAAVDAIHLDADMMRARVVDAIRARALSGESGQCHARPAALLERRAVDVEFPRMRVVVVVCVHVEAAVLAVRRTAQCEQNECLGSHLDLWRGARTLVCTQLLLCFASSELLCSAVADYSVVTY